MTGSMQQTGATHLAIVDPCSAAGYDLTDLETRGLGGTEATILRVASALRPRFDIAIFQAGRQARKQSLAGDLLPVSALNRQAEAPIYIVINRWKVALKLRKRYPAARILLWLHVYPGRHNRKMGAALRGANIPVICVSETHARKLAAFLEPEVLPVMRVIYNPIADGLRPDGTRRNLDRLLFASSPHKGLGEVFRQFSNLRQKFPDLTLAVADPGYLKWETGPIPEGVVFLGSLSHAGLIRQMRRALCLFYPQTQFAETYGLVLAEANAVGTPVLVHDGLGANAEIVPDPVQRVDGNDSGQINRRIDHWRRALPNVAVNSEFRLDSVAQKWARYLLEEIEAPAHRFAPMCKRSLSE